MARAADYSETAPFESLCSPSGAANVTVRGTPHDVLGAFKDAI
jgi:hypothetical protein